jgi:hypothetical protein
LVQVLRGSALSIASGFIPEPADTDIMSSHQDQALKTSQDESPTRNLSNIPYRPSVGDNDLFPFSPLVGRNPNGGGSLVGPGHPLFGRTPMYDPHNPDHFLQPRFDPVKQLNLKITRLYAFDLLFIFTFVVISCRRFQPSIWTS